MIEIIAKILGRLVNVALGIIIAIITLVLLRERSELNLALIALISILVAIIGTTVIRLLVKFVERAAARFSK